MRLSKIARSIELAIYPLKKSIDELRDEAKSQYDAIVISILSAVCSIVFVDGFKTLWSAILTPLVFSVLFIIFRKIKDVICYIKMQIKDTKKSDSDIAELMDIFVKEIYPNILAVYSYCEKAKEPEITVEKKNLMLFQATNSLEIVKKLIIEYNIIETASSGSKDKYRKNYMQFLNGYRGYFIKDSIHSLLVYTKMLLAYFNNPSNAVCVYINENLLKFFDMCDRCISDAVDTSNLTSEQIENKKDGKMHVFEKYHLR